MSRADEVLDAIDHALEIDLHAFDDVELSSDAMRWSPEPPPELPDDTPQPPVYESVEYRGPDDRTDYTARYGGHVTHIHAAQIQLRSYHHYGFGDTNGPALAMLQASCYAEGGLLRDSVRRVQAAPPEPDTCRIVLDEARRFAEGARQALAEWQRRVERQALRARVHRRFRDRRPVDHFPGLTWGDLRRLASLPPGVVDDEGQLRFLNVDLELRAPRRSLTEERPHGREAEIRRQAGREVGRERRRIRR